jgi:hypothetical protein
MRSGAPAQKPTMANGGRDGHGLTAETTVVALEDIEDITHSKQPLSRITRAERELVLRLASLRRATAIETDLLVIQAEFSE